jgi:hypothetical protein
MKMEIPVPSTIMRMAIFIVTQQMGPRELDSMKMEKRHLDVIFITARTASLFGRKI